MVRPIRYYLDGLYRELWRKPIFLWAQAIAFKVLLAIVPLLLLGTGILGQVLRQQRPFAYVEGVVRNLFPEYGADQLVAFLSGLQDAGGRFTLIGALGMVVTSVTLFTTLRIVLGHIFSEEWHQQRTALRGYLFDLQMAVQTGVLLLSSIGVTVFIQTADPAGVEQLDSAFVTRTWDWIAQGSLYALPVLLTVTMFFQLYWFIPIPKPPKRAALAGAVVGALLWEAAKIGVTEYAARFGVEGGWQSALGDTFLLVILIVLWAYYSGLVLNMGAIVALLYERAHRETVPHHPTRIVETASTEVSANVRDL